MRSFTHTFLASLTTLVLAAASLSGTVGASPQHDHDHGVVAAPRAFAPQKAAPANVPLPPLPSEGYAPSRPMEVVKATYEFAARHPEVLQYVPCYCGCDRSAGHRGNHDCFVKRRGADGRILEWDSHGYGCAICMDVARDSMQLFNSGAKPAAIRAAIDAKYGSRLPTTMNTPKPPAASK